MFNTQPTELKVEEMMWADLFNSLALHRMAEDNGRHGDRCALAIKQSMSTTVRRLRSVGAWQ